MARGAGPIPHARVRAPPLWPPRWSKRVEVSLPGAGYGAFMVAQVVLNFLLQNQVKSECLETNKKLNNKNICRFQFYCIRIQGD